MPRRWTAASILLAAVLAWPSTLEAATGGFVVTPAFQSVAISASQPSAQYTLELTNKTGADQNFRLSTTDFGSLDESGGVAFIGAPTSELEHRYGLASWMTLGANTVFVAAGKSVEVGITINNRASLSPGGHYGAVLATAVTDTGAPDVSDTHVGVREVLSSLILLTKSGGAEAGLKLAGQTNNAQIWRLPSSVELRFQNTGNVHLVPRGIIEVKDPAGRIVERAAIDPDSGVILPESFRRYPTPLMRLGVAPLPGRYSVTTTYRYDGTDKTTSVTTHIWYIGQLIVWLVLIGALVTAALWGWWLWRRRRRVR